VTKVKATIVSSGNGRGALPAGIRILAKGGSALDAVEACARIIEADPTDQTVGYGGLPNVLGEVELDASIVDGTTHRAGSVAALTGFLHPITVARGVMERLPHVMLVGAGAARFAREIGAEEGDLLTPAAREQWIAVLRDAKHTPASIASAKELAPVVWTTVQERGTVNFIAIDKRGNVASAVSTSGWGFKYPGRVGDSPVIGAGHYSDSRYGGAACTGFGELALRNVTTKTAVDRIAAGRSVEQVATDAIADANALESSGGVRLNIVVLAANGDHAAATTTRNVQYAYQSVGMTRAAVKPRSVVRRRSA
jgi:beta-aspartyl-peptidase (threonine type)